MSDVLRHPLRTHTVRLQEQLNAAYKPGSETEAKKGVSLEADGAADLKFCLRDAFHLLGVFEQIKAERVRGRQDVIQQVHSSSQVARLDQSLKQPDSIGAKVFQAKGDKNKLDMFQFIQNLLHVWAPTYVPLLSWQWTNSIQWGGLFLPPVEQSACWDHVEAQLAGLMPAQERSRLLWGSGH